MWCGRQLQTFGIVPGAPAAGSRYHTDFQALVGEGQKSGMPLMLDLAANHTGRIRDGTTAYLDVDGYPYDVPGIEPLNFRREAIAELRAITRLLDAG